MTDRPAERASYWKSDTFLRKVAQRHARERRFKALGLGAILLAMAMLALLLGSILATGLPAFTQTQIRVPVVLDPQELFSGDLAEDPSLVGAADLPRANYAAVVRDGLEGLFPEVTGRREQRALGQLVSRIGGEDAVRDVLEGDLGRIGETVDLWLPAAGPIDQFHRNDVTVNVSEDQQSWVGRLAEMDRIGTAFNWRFLTGGASREAELAGLGAALVGSVLTLIVTLALTFPIGVAAAVYLEEFAPKNRWTDLIEVNINNLAAVPSIVFGLLGLSVFLNFFGMPRSAAVAGGVVLALMTLPTIIIAARAALKAVPPSIREAALGLGASRLQTVTHHVLPLALPGIMTGTIIGMAQALGETAPLLMMGMVAFIVDIPGSFTDPATVLPVQIYQWAGFPERGFREKTAAAIIVLLVFLVLMNAMAVWLRRRFERRW